jgi:hypothetical protein
MIIINITGWWFGTFFIFPYIGNVIIPTDELIFFRGVGIPPTRLSLSTSWLNTNDYQHLTNHDPIPDTIE